MHFAGDDVRGSGGDRSARRRIRRRGGRQLGQGLLLALCCLCLGYGLAVLSAVPVEAETLRRALSHAYNYSPTLKAQRAALRVTDEEMARARSGFRPTVTGQYDKTLTDTRSRPASAFDGRTNADSFRIDFSQPVFRGFRTINSVREADANIFAGREGLRLAEQRVLLDAVTAFMDVVRDHNIVRHRRGNVRNLERQLQAARDRLEVGEATRTDVAQAQARLAQARSLLAAARGNLRASKASYRQYVGKEARNLRRPRNLEAMLPRSLAEALRVGTRENPEILQAIFLEKAARHAIDRINGEFLPEVSVQASYQKQWDPLPTVDERDTVTVTGQVRVPLYQAGEVSARSRQSVNLASQRRREVAAAREKVKAQIIAAWAQRQAARAQVQSDLAQVRANRTALEGVREELKEGQRSVLNLLDAEQELVASLVALEGSQRDLVVTAFNLVAAIGRLTAADLRLDVELYDPQAHYRDVKRKIWGPGRYGQDAYDY